jgi:hypothetical protein
MRICVCGGRDYNDKQKVWDTLDTLRSFVPYFTLVHGDAKGADSLADDWARCSDLETDPFPADWEQHGKAAGPIRNRQMIASGIDLLLAFPGGKGTADMVAACKKAGIAVKEIK